MTTTTSPTMAGGSRPAATRSSGGLKVRDCCQACAKSKVRCTKERPSCSRCESKGIECRYLHCKRPGRVPGSSARRATSLSTDQTKSRTVGTADAGNTLGHQNSPSPSPHASTTAEHNTASLLLSPASSTTLPSGRAQCSTSAHHRVDSFQTHMDPSDALPPDFFPPFNLDNSSSTNGAWDDCLDTLAAIDAPMYTDLMDWDSSAAPMATGLPLDSTLGLDMLDGSTGSQSPFDLLVPSTSNFSTESSSRASSSESLMSSASSMLPLFSSASSSSSSSASSSASSSSSRHSSLPRDVVALTALPGGQTCSQPAHPEAVNSTVLKADKGINCNCLHKALDLFKTITQNPCSDPSTVSGSPLTQLILAKNKRTIQAMLALVNCNNCRDDKLLIVVALLITMKMLSWYASAAALTGGPGVGTSSNVMDRVPMTSGHGSPVSATSTATGRHQPCHRQAKQQVLRELHSVQRLITSLSARLKGLDPHPADSLPAQNELERSYYGRRRTMPTTLFRPNAMDPTLVPLSARTLEAVEADARSSLGFLSAAVRNALKES
ncbi:hypothetical protein COCC4DRAFT_58688 [Bipolaris maydis ATCC 48331]|uniref:Zn(2)-C6 fungal-type domain-containing protein n=2 Tax=Cochliobolus heterostrophus TaxID=5016 RepID=M2UJT6_COCH5|nr:uncharacterized protein COCC4DRAFT_58688 [Bipolaris maydis ATCC 48331]EMD93906.1 hypothetical protein COCHEDRAFT_1211370 [Bipolaris maydis C5]KAH7564255.1 hypothetical protein BM1_01302 [Bipolaris maydis]ENI07790.1 hypothetical protein COCC4DRAFT_58688 [Bipolaris maydis ATCC 48331]KAJ5026877.1 hypothetical protein J3E73DRAFT_411640 [Bipolaris maydis]KAJ5042575.1 C6 zinc finger domain-containing protein [Bipolaris maydis]